jgi:hypothetical protein
MAWHAHAPRCIRMTSRAARPGAACAAQCCAVCVCRGERSGAGLRLHHLNRGRERKPKRGSRRTTRHGPWPGARRASLDVLGSRMLLALALSWPADTKSAGGSQRRSSATEEQRRGGAAPSPARLGRERMAPARGKSRSPSPRAPSAFPLPHREHQSDQTQLGSTPLDSGLGFSLN